MLNNLCFENLSSGKLKIYFFLLLFISSSLICFTGCFQRKESAANEKLQVINDTISFKNATQNDKDSVKIIIGTYLGNETRNYYGEDPPDKLNLKWKLYLGKGKSEGKHGNIKEWAGTGWTGQPLLTKESGELYLYTGALDYHLKKIKASIGELVWQYKFDDAIKGTGSIFVNSKSSDLNSKYTIVQGSKRGYCLSLGAKYCYSLRGVSMFNGSEAWRYNVKHTYSASRDVDGSVLICNDTIIAPLENGYLSFLDANSLTSEGKYNFPYAIAEVPLYNKKHFRKNLIAEGSPSLIDNIIYNTCGSGYLYGVDKITKNIVFEFYIGADLNGTSPVTNDSCLLVSVEKEYIPGSGGLFKINPKYTGNDCVEWFFPSGNKTYSDWNGGIIGSASVAGDDCVTNSIDGYLYFINHKRTDKTKSTNGPDLSTIFLQPVLLDKVYIGPSISTPIIIGKKVIACSYNGIYLFQINGENKLELLDKFETGFESTPISYDGKIYVGSRDGYMYCFGD